MSLICKFSKLINENFNVYSGNDDINVALMSMGGAGSISGIMANILPKEVHDIAMACQNGDFETARKMQLKYLDFINALFIETNPIPIKEAMNLAGLNVGGYRLPLCPMADDTKAVLKAEMEKLGLILKQVFLQSALRAAACRNETGQLAGRVQQTYERGQQ